MKTLDAYQALSALIPSLVVVADTIGAPASSNLGGQQVECIMSSNKPVQQASSVPPVRGKWESVARLTIGKPPRAPKV